MLQKKVLASLFAVCLGIGLFHCGKPVGKYENIPEVRLVAALDSAELMFISPVGEKIIKRVLNDILTETNLTLRIRGLRIASTVLLSNNDVSSLAQLDSAVSFVMLAESLARADGDSVEWALCTIQVFRYKSLKHEWYFGGNEKIGSKEKLRQALKVLERHKLTDALSVGYRTLSHGITIDDEGMAESLRYDLLALHCNDSSKYPVLRARSCADLSNKYLYLGQKKMAESFCLRAIEIFKYYDTLHHSVSLTQLANIVNDDVKTPYYYRLAAQVAKACKATTWEADVYFQLAQRFQNSGAYDSALYYLRKSIRTVPDNLIDYAQVIAGRESVLALSYLRLGQSEKAKQLVAVRERLLKKNWNTEDRRQAELYGLAEMYETLGDYEKLTHALTEVTVLADSLYSKERLVAIGKAQGRFELELKDKQLEVLQMSEELHATAAERQIWVRFLLISVAVLTTFGLLLVHVLLTRQNKLNKSLQAQNKTIEEQKNEIEKSLRELEQAQAHILNSEKMVMLGQFTAGVAHELNNPLNFISGGVSVLEEAVEDAGTDVDEEDIRILHKIRDGVDRAMEIVSSLRVFINPRSEIGFDSHSSLEQCVNASLLVLQSKMRATNVRVVADFPDYIVVGHSGQVCQIFINLIDNAIHAVKDLSSERKTIEIQARKAGSQVLIDFKDQGSGIPESIQRNLFRAFFTTKPSGQGIGLGLFICNTILQGIGGAITFASEPDRGTTFTVQMARPR